MLLSNRIEELKNVNIDQSQKVFSMYLNTDRKRMDQQKGEWKIHLKNGLKRLKEYIENSDDRNEIRQIHTIKEKVEREIHENQTDLLRSVVLFATADDTIWFADYLQVPVETAFYWEDEPVLDPLQSLENKYPYMGIVVLQQDEAAVLETETGTLKDRFHYTLDLNTNDWRQHQGPQDMKQRGLSMAGGSQKDEFKERFKAHQQRWYKSLVSKVEQKAGKKNWEQIYLVGEKEEVEALKKYFNKEIDKVIPRNILNRDTDTILTEVLA